MKKLLIILTLISAVYQASAQQKTLPSDVKKIVLYTSESMLGPNVGVEIQILNEHGKWNSYQTVRDYFNADQGAPEPNGIDSTRKLIATLTQKQVSDFLSSIAVMKPLDDNTFKLTPDKLLADIRSRIKNNSKANLAKLPGLIYKESVQRAVRGVLTDRSAYDWAKNCSINVVKNNGQTLKMSTDHLYVTMLPWVFENGESYDVNINAFFLAAIGNQKYPNRETLDIGNLEDCIYDYLGGNHIAGTLKISGQGIY